MNKIVVIFLFFGISQILSLGCHHVLRKAGPGERCRQKNDCLDMHTCWRGHCYVGECLKPSDCPNGWLGCVYKIRHCGKDIAHMRQIRWKYPEYPYPKGFTLPRRMTIVFPASRPTLHLPSHSKKRTLGRRNLSHTKKKLARRSDLPPRVSRNVTIHPKRKISDIHRRSTHHRRRKYYLYPRDFWKLKFSNEMFYGFDFLLSVPKWIGMNPNFEYTFLLWHVGSFSLGFPIRFGYFGESKNLHNIILSPVSFMVRYWFSVLFLDSVFRFSYGIPVGRGSGHRIRFDAEVGVGINVHRYGLYKLYVGISYEYLSTHIVFIGPSHVLFYPAFFLGFAFSFLALE